MANCYIIDDEIHAIEILIKFIEETPDLELIGSSTNPVEALNSITQNPPDMVFLDIDMLKLTGLELAGMIKGLTKIVFTTAFAKYALPAFDYEAVDYLLKPIAYSRFLIATEKVKAQLNSNNKHKSNSNNDFFYIKNATKGKIIRVNFEEIIYVKAALNYVAIVLDKVEHLTYLTMKEIEEALPSDLFVRIHKSYIVNENKITLVEHSALVLNNQTIIPFGSSYRAKFFEKLNKKMINSKRF